jgi:hypothetical protein
MKKYFNYAVAATALLAVAAVAMFVLRPATTGAQDWGRDRGSGDSLYAQLISFNQVPAVLATSHGDFQAEINADNTISFELSYSEMSSPVTQAHIHFGASRTNGGIMVFLCGGAKPACPASGTITGTLTAADVSVLPVGNADSVIPQGIAPGDFAGMLEAIQSGNSYVNVHTTNFPSGEIRGQVKFR